MSTATQSPMIRMTDNDVTFEYRLVVGDYHGAITVYQDDYEDGECWGSSPVIGGFSSEHDAANWLSAEVENLRANPNVQILS